MTTKIIWKDHVYYDEESPSFLRWARFAANNKIKPGSVAGRINGEGYYSTYILTKRYPNSRIIYELLYNEKLSEGCVVDHLDGNPSNNKKTNLRKITFRENTLNQKIRTSNKSGIPGVHFDRIHGGFWICQYIEESGRRIKKAYSIAKLGLPTAMIKAVKQRLEHNKTRGYIIRGAL